ncbi:class I adenylate-forming enzyme family protein [Roseovarius sp.]|uniref:class I adenylate-forming enzyme family protein n=1 Tax=Roseovarius sp. TaxID=1486281 RepID=UPI002604AD02|nr:class I adenylate-forming enzyme family protein [Roseovarius sp.]MDM8166691.1 class I adenylate-forming enzyme family protein [Roseovarius sp.]
MTPRDGLNHPAIGGTVGGMFRDAAIGSPDEVAVRDGSVSLTYRDFNARVNKLTAALHDRGLSKGDRVALLSENCIDYVTVLMACAKGGFVAACLNWRQTRRELDGSIALTEPALLFVSSDFLDRCPEEVPQVVMGEPFEQLLAGRDDAEPEVEVESEDGLIILYTSGTTGTSKGALISHRAMIARGLLMRADWSIRRSDGFIAWSPLFHMASADPTFATLTQGATVSVLAGFDPAGIVEALTCHDVGWMVLMPGMIERLAEELEQRNAPLRRVAAAGCMANLVPTEQISRISRLLNAPFLNSFGSSETGIAPASGNWIAPGEDPGDLGKRQNSSCEIKLVGEDGMPVSDGAVGEICLKSPLLFSGYLNDPEATAKAFRDSWYHMGDAFYRDTSGRLHFADRKKYLIKSGGENIYPAEIELLLRNTPGISDAVVVKRIDDRWGEVPVAFVVAETPGLSRDDVLDALKGKIARYKLPKDIHLIGPEEIERNPTGKIRRDLLEKRAQQTADAEKDATT